MIFFPSAFRDVFVFSFCRRRSCLFVCRRLFVFGRVLLRLKNKEKNAQLRRNKNELTKKQSLSRCYYQHPRLIKRTVYVLARLYVYS